MTTSRRVNSVTLTAVTPTGSIALVGGSPQSLTLSPDGTTPGVTDINLATVNAATFTSANIVVKVGALQQTIEIRKVSGVLSYSGGATQLNYQPGVYTTAELVNPSTPSWFTLSTDGTNDVGSSYTQPNAASLTPVYLKTESNDFFGRVERTGEVFLSRATEGRVKAYIGQMAPECTLYVGMFGGELKEDPITHEWQFERPLYVQCADASTGIQWQTTTAETFITNKWNGRGNTYDLYNAGTTHPAANLCFAKNSGIITYTDITDYSSDYIWYLPAQNQLMACWVIQTFSSNYFYWNSTEYTTLTTNAWNVHFSDGLTYYGIKTNISRVRCVREL